MFLLEFCAETANIWKVLGWVVFIMKIVIPLLLIIFGMLDLGKAVISSDEKAMSKAVGTLIKRFIAAVVVFFVPSLVSALFNVLVGINFSSEDSSICITCVTDVQNCDTSGVVGNLTN